MVVSQMALGELVFLLVEKLNPFLSALLASYITYFFGVKKLKRDKMVTRQIDLYASLINYLATLPDRLDDKSEENLNLLATEFNEIHNKMLLISPDHIVEKTLSSMDKIKKGTTMENLGVMIITLRKEFIPKTNLTPNSVVTLTFRS